nr:helix-turn-helix domain-containing protein [Allocoleopsis franciscana]
MVLPHLARQTLPQYRLDGCRYRLGKRPRTDGGRRMKPRPLTEREQTLIDFYGYCQLGMTPQQFYAKWQVNHEAIAFICSRSMSTVRRWFRRGKNYRRPQPSDLRHLALMDFLLEHYQDIPEQLLNALCSPKRNP